MSRWSQRHLRQRCPRRDRRSCEYPTGRRPHPTAAVAGVPSRRRDRRSLVGSLLTTAPAAGIEPAADGAYRFDFGTATSPVAEGYQQALTTTIYTAELGWGIDPGRGDALRPRPHRRPHARRSAGGGLRRRPQLAVPRRRRRRRVRRHRHSATSSWTHRERTRPWRSRTSRRRARPRPAAGTTTRRSAPSSPTGSSPRLQRLGRRRLRQRRDRAARRPGDADRPGDHPPRARRRRPRVAGVEGHPHTGAPRGHVDDGARRYPAWPR